MFSTCFFVQLCNGTGSVDAEIGHLLLEAWRMTGIRAGSVRGLNLQENRLVEGTFLLLL